MEVDLYTLWHPSGPLECVCVCVCVCMHCIYIYSLNVFFFFNLQNSLLCTLTMLKCLPWLNDRMHFWILCLTTYSLCVYVLVAQLCPTLCKPMDYSPPGYSVQGILQARVIEWVAIPFSRGSSQLRDWTQVSYIADKLFTFWASPV